MDKKEWNLAHENYEHSHRKALEIIGQLFKDGNNGFVIQTIFMTGAAMTTSMNGMDKETFMDGVDSVYELYKDFGDRVDEVTKKIKKS